jgi:hypothetical protein
VFIGPALMQAEGGKLAEGKYHRKTTAEDDCRAHAAKDAASFQAF